MGADEEDKETVTLENEKAEAKAKGEPRGGTEFLDNKVEANNAKAEADDRFKEEAEETAILITAEYSTKDKTDTEKAEAIIKAKKDIKDKGKMDEKGKDRKAEVEKDPKL